MTPVPCCIAMFGLGPKLPSAALLTLGAAAALGTAILAGFAPTPPIFQVVLTLVVAAALGFAVATPVRAALASWRQATVAAAGVHRRTRTADAPADPPRPLTRPSWPRIAVTAVLVVLLVLGCWVYPLPLLRWLFGYLAFVLPVLPLFLLPGSSRVTLGKLDTVLVPFVERRFWSRDELLTLGTGLLRWLRVRLFTRITGTAVAVLGLLHLLRSSPGLDAVKRAGGFAGWLVGEPLRLVFSAGGGIALLLATVACVAVVLAGYVWQLRRLVAGYVALGLAFVLPVTAVSVGHRVGFDYYLTTQGSRVVVVAGLSPTQRHAVYDAGLAVDGLTPSLKTLFAKGLPVADRDDGTRIAKALAHPATAPVYEGDQYELKTGECFDFIGGSSQLRYVAPCNGSHVGEVYFVGHLPFTVDPGTAAVQFAARAMCEQSYGDYLGVPFGQSYLPLEAPLMPPGKGWSAKPVIACWLGAVGPWALKGSKTVAALQQKVPWAGANGCKIELPDALRVTAGTANTRCVAPGPGQTLAVPNSGYSIDLEFSAIGKNAGNARVGAACLDGSNLADGYTFEVIGSGVIEVWKHNGDQHSKLGASAKPKGAGGPATATTAMQVSCKVVPGKGVELAANSTGSRKLAVLDATAPITKLSPRLLFISAEVAPAAMTVVIFNATRL
jgi:hypothetical protein